MTCASLRPNLARIALAALLLAPPAARAALEVVGTSPYTLSPAVALGSYYDITLQIRNAGTTPVKLGAASTTGPFTLQWNFCGATLAPGATCEGNYGIRFTPTAAGTANGSFIVANDGPDGPFTLPLVASGTALRAPTLSVAANPAAVYATTGVTTFSYTLGNPNDVPIVPVFFSVPLKDGFLTAAVPNATSTCGGAWNGIGDGVPASQSYLAYRGIGAVFIAPHGSCTLTFDVTTTNPPGTYEAAWPQSFQTGAVWGDQSPSLKVTVLAPIAGAPGAPIVGSATAGNASATVAFAPPASSGASPITGYTVRSIPPGGVDTQAGSAALTHTITGLVNGTTYTFAVTAANSAGSGPPSAPSNPVTPGTVPSAPSNVIATAGNAQAIVTFAVPADSGGRAISGYVVTSNPPGGVDAHAGGTGQRHVITGLANGTAYTFTVVAANALGSGPASSAASAVVPTAAVAQTPRQTGYRVGPTRTAIPVPTLTIPAYPTTRPHAYAYSSPRALGFADFDGDGRTDILIAPTYGQNPPFFPLEVWLTNADGTFRNGTAEVFDGPPPVTRAVDGVLIADFNGDGRSDAFLFDTGIEFAVALGLPDSGAKNSLVLSNPDGRYRDATAQIVPGLQAFNHSAALGDFNGDGYFDVANFRGESSVTDQQGLVLLRNDGSGHFVETTAALPPEIASMPISQRDYRFAQDIGCVGGGDLDGDGRSDLLTASGYNSREPAGGRTLRIFRQQENGAFVERNRLPIPDALKDVGEVSATIGADGRGLGCAGSGMVVVDLNGDGRDDVIVPWEGVGKMYVQILRNDGNFQFTDVTLEWLGSYSTNFLDGPFASPGQIRVVDANGDGTPDLAYVLNATSLTNTLRHAVMLNDGTGHFTPWRPQGTNGDLTEAEILAVAKCTTCGYEPMLLRTVPGSLPSIVLMDGTSDVTTDLPTQTKTVFLTTLTPVAMPSVPDAPSIASVVGGDGKATVTFAPSAHDGGSAVTGYTVTPSRGGGVDLQAGNTALTHVVTGLANGVPLTFTVKAHNSVGTSLPSAPSRAVMPSAANYGGIWWNSPAGSEPGWGINFAHQGDTIFATWFTYATDGAPLWLVVAATRTANGDYAGDLYTTTGPSFDALPFDPAKVTATKVGTATLAFADAANATFSYQVGAVAQTKSITRQQFASPQPVCTWSTEAPLALATNIQDKWWAAPAASEAGWGINLAHQGDTIFATWFTYRADGKPTWLVVAAAKTAEKSYAGTLYMASSGPPLGAATFDPARVVGTAVGAASLAFTDGNSATFSYTVNGVVQSRSITREVFAAPGTVCR